MDQFGVKLVDGHVIVQVDGAQALVDTGCPVTFGRRSHLRIEGVVHRVAAAHGTTRIEEVAALVGADLDVLVGMDVLRRTGLTLDRRTRELSFGARPVDGFVLPARTDFVPIVEATINGMPTTAIFDTGAKISYALPELIESAPVCGTATDFQVGPGRYEVELRPAAIGLGPVAFEAAIAAVKHREIRRLMSTLGAGAILGTDVLAHLPVVCLDASAGSLAFGR